MIISRISSSTVANEIKESPAHGHVAAISPRPKFRVSAQSIAGSSLDRDMRVSSQMHAVDVWSIVFGHADCRRALYPHPIPCHPIPGRAANQNVLMKAKNTARSLDLRSLRRLRIGMKRLALIILRVALHCTD